MNNNLSLKLKEYGLQEKEIKIFLFLVGKNRLSAYRISKETGLHKSTVYDTLDRLVEKGFILKENSGKNLLYHANEINSVISGLKSKEDLLESIIPDLSNLNRDDKPYVRILKGDLGQKQFNFELLNYIKQKEIDELLMIGNSPPSSESSLIFIEKIIKEATKLKAQRNKSYKGLWATSLKNNKFVKLYEKFGENRFLEKLSDETVTIIFNGKVIYLFEESGEPYLLEIRNKSVYLQMKNYFELLWQIAKK